MAVRRPTPAAPRDSFEGAEASARTQGRQALETIAEYGRRGAEALANQRRAAAGQTRAIQRDMSSLAADFDAPDALTAELQAKARSALAPYARDADVAARGYAEDLKATAGANRTYYDQVAQGVPMLRSAAQQTVAQYRTAWEENESRRVAEEEQRELARRQQEEAMAFARQQQAQQMELARAAQAQQVAMENARMRAQAEQAAAQLALQRRQLDLAYPGPNGTRTFGEAMAARRRRGWGR
ncbi:MAG TPA: hypothetical protein VK975_00105 [Acidimicrobiales bacterium]|nr:hypothetical protein [Acidimicrobiales bacterium]